MLLYLDLINQSRFRSLGLLSLFLFHLRQNMLWAEPSLQVFRQIEEFFFMRLRNINVRNGRHSLIHTDADLFLLDVPELLALTPSYHCCIISGKTHKVDYYYYRKLYIVSAAFNRQEICENATGSKIICNKYLQMTAATMCFIFCSRCNCLLDILLELLLTTIASHSGPCSLFFEFHQLNDSRSSNQYQHYPSAEPWLSTEFCVRGMSGTIFVYTELQVCVTLNSSISTLAKVKIASFWNCIRKLSDECFHWSNLKICYYDFRLQNDIFLHA